MDGNEKNLIILTRTRDYRKELKKSNIIAAETLEKKYPRIKNILLKRHIRYNKTVEFVNRL